ncbi:MAG: radical SAM protein, partial [Chitinivibrionales bacterium]|nr:radical SAM protein [Chitinivibrionales bacterium]
PDICFFSLFAFCYAQPAIELASEIKSLKPAITICIGGAGVAAYPDYFIRNQAIDFAFTAEAETCLNEFLAQLHSPAPDFSSVPGLWRKEKQGRYRSTVPVLTTPQDIELMCVKTHETSRRIYLSTSLSRGCPRQCRFCANHLSHGKPFRAVEKSVAIEKISAALHTYHNPAKEIGLNFEDDNILADPDYFLSILAALKESAPPFTFATENGIDYTFLTQSLLEYLVDLGMRQANISIGTSHNHIAEKENRTFNKKHFESIINALNLLKIPSITYFICGLKGDTRESIAETLSYLSILHTLTGISLFYAVPGLPDFTDKTIFGKNLPSLCCGSSAYPWNESLTTQTMVTAFRLSRYINICKQPSPSPQDRALIEKIRSERRLYTLVNKGDKKIFLPVENMDDELVGMVLAEYLAE